MSENNQSNGPERPGAPVPPGTPNPGDQRRGIVYTILTLALIGYIVFSFMPGFMSGQAGAAELPTNDVVTAIKEDRVDNLTYRAASGELAGEYWDNKQDVGDDSKLVAFKSSYVGSDSLSELMEEHPGTTYVVDTSNDDWIETLLFTVLPTLIMVAVFVYFMRGMQNQNGRAMGFGKTKAKTTEQTRPKVKFADVAGVDEAVEELKEIRDFLAEPERFQKMGAKIPRGVLLVGPPGTGKTLLAKAVAGEAGVPFFSISGSDFVEMFVGVGASRVRDLFKQAKAASPSIIFIDEIDAVGRQRGAGLGGGHDEREQTLNQLLVEMDGFEANDAVILIAATNRPDILDPALLRPGRFDRQVTVDRPDVLGREHILRVHAENKPLAPDVDFKRLAQLTPGFTGADLMNLMNESALLAARRNKPQITMAEVEEAMERVIAGPERKSRVMTAEERKTIAYHESGHALVGHILDNADPVHKISIIARGQALGYTLSLPEEDHFLNTRNGMLDQIAVLLGGRTAEELFCNDITTGASNDLERATKIARQMVTRLGMSEELGTQVFGEAQHEVFLGRDYADHQDYSAETAKRIDDEVERIMREAHNRARAVLEARRDQMDTMAEVLLSRETVEGEAVKALLDNEWDNYLEAHPEETVGKQAAPGEVDEAVAAEAAAAAHAALAAESGDAADDAAPAKEPAAGEDANAN
ncbi:MAG: ATP-dependent zinc metalloprotease FtsH [Parolsenella sp.]|uniref:ATP-dependent zinc metalloprotease FtsH n=1 Tax=Parolsenella sp. TaxID=2083006 RepID=UPI002A757C4D|nr:ATP-dependent zinc metalloprotease FtsH [Parolsenella sp.]MDY3292582.1 ATP-dependent zinc metalloprotease FtsH [Parolsenella sp.]